MEWDNARRSRARFFSKNVRASSIVTSLILIKEDAIRETDLKF